MPTCKTDMQKHQHKNMRKVKKPCKCCINRDRWVDSNTSHLAFKLALFMQSNTWGLPFKLPTSNALKTELRMFHLSCLGKFHSRNPEHV